MGERYFFVEEKKTNLKLDPFLIFFFSDFSPRYESLKTYATVSKDSAETVDFRLTRLPSDRNNQHIVGPQPTENPSEKALRSLIKDLSLGQGLEQLVRNTATETKFHYRRYKELSGFLNGLMLNFPTITSLRRYQGLYRLLSPVFNPTNVISDWFFCLRSFFLYFEWHQYLYQLIQSLPGFLFHYFLHNTANNSFSSFLLSKSQSVEFRAIMALEISNKPQEPEPSKPKIRFVAGVHGNAPVGTALLLELAAFLCINYGKNPNITRVSS